jgi:hypothetical protein
MLPTQPRLSDGCGPPAYINDLTQWYAAQANIAAFGGARCSQGGSKLGRAIQGIGAFCALSLDEILSLPKTPSV